jgi:hypothetical protein
MSNGPIPRAPVPTTMGADALRIDRTMRRSFGSTMIDFLLNLHFRLVSSISLSRTLMCCMMPRYIGRFWVTRLSGQKDAKLSHGNLAATVPCRQFVAPPDLQTPASKFILPQRRKKYTNSEQMAQSKLAGRTAAIGSQLSKRFPVPAWHHDHPETKRHSFATTTAGMDDTATSPCGPEWWIHAVVHGAANVDLDSRRSFASRGGWCYTVGGFEQRS